MAVSLDIAERLSAMPESSAVAMQINVNSYFDVLRGIMSNFARAKNLEVIYITITIPSHSIMSALSVLEIDMEDVYFVDAISRIMMGPTSKSKHVLYVESPTMLENIMLKVEYLTQRKGGKDRGKVVVLDSINSLAIHNNNKILSEFLHVLVNNLRSKNAYTIILSVDEQQSEELMNMTNFVCDDTIIVEDD